MFRVCFITIFVKHDINSPGLNGGSQALRHLDQLERVELLHTDTEQESQSGKQKSHPWFWIAGSKSQISSFLIGIWNPPLYKWWSHHHAKHSCNTGWCYHKNFFSSPPQSSGVLWTQHERLGTQFHFNLLKQLLMFKHAMHCHSPQKPTMHQIWSSL